MPAKKPRLTSDQLELIRLLGTLFEGSRTVFGIKDTRHRYLYVNEETAHALGHPAEEIIGSRPDKFMTPSSARAMHQHQEEVMASRCATRFVDQIGPGSQSQTFATIYFPLKNGLGIVTSVGFIGVHIQDQAGLNADLQHMLQEAQVTIAQLQKCVEEMHWQAMTDPLTGVWNRVQAEVIGRQEMAKQERASTEVSLMFIDLDHFKNVNDTWGHTIGDAVLTEFCQVLKKALRTADVLARWGGEEFIIILPDTGLDAAACVAERIRMDVECHRFEHISSLTASFGVAAYFQGEPWHHWTERADTALYRAKSKGRNRIELDSMHLAEGIPADIAHSAGFLRLTWRSRYESGHPLIDLQHRRLFAHANNLLSAVLAGKPKDAIRHLIDDLITAVRDHFRDEEAIIREAGFPESDAHAQIHDQILEKAEQLSKRYHDEKLELGELFSFLAYDVVARHMLVDDREFFYCLNNTPPAAAQPEAKPPQAKPASSRTKKTASSPEKQASAGAAKPAKSKKTAAPKAKKVSGIRGKKSGPA